MVCWCCKLLSFECALVEAKVLGEKAVPTNREEYMKREQAREGEKEKEREKRRNLQETLAKTDGAAGETILKKFASHHTTSREGGTGCRLCEQGPGSRKGARRGETHVSIWLQPYIAVRIDIYIYILVYFHSLLHSSRWLPSTRETISPVWRHTDTPTSWPTGEMPAR